MTSAEAWFNIALRPRKPEGSLGRTAQDGHLDSHTAPELSHIKVQKNAIYMCSELVWPSGKAGKQKVRVRFVSPFSSKVGVCGHCLVTLPLMVSVDVKHHVYLPFMRFKKREGINLFFGSCCTVIV